MASATEWAIETTALVKTFGSTRAVDGVDLNVRAGEVFGFLGPNGAGKTTTIRMLATLLPPDAGTARVLGHDLLREARSIRRRVSLTGQYASVDEDLTGWENLVLLARLLGYPRADARARADELLAAFGLADAGQRQVRTFSGGMRRRLDIAASIIVTPDLLFLDEPTTGLDPASRNQVWQIVRALAAGGTTVLLTTQYLDEADQLADRIAVIDAGRIVAEGTSTELKSSLGRGGTLRVRLAEDGDRDVAARILGAALDAPVDLDDDPRTLSVRVTDPGRALAGLGELAGAGVAVATFGVDQPTLDEVFLALTGHPAGPTGARQVQEVDA